MTTVSVLGPGGYPKAPYGSYAGKPVPPSVRYSVLGPGGYPRPPYASFAGKTPAATTQIHFTKFFADVGAMMTR